MLKLGARKIVVSNAAMSTSFILLSLAFAEHVRKKRRTQTTVHSSCLRLVSMKNWNEYTKIFGTDTIDGVYTYTKPPSFISAQTLDTLAILMASLKEEDGGMVGIVNQKGFELLCTVPNGMNLFFCPRNILPV